MQNGLSVIPKSSNVDRMRQNLEVFGEDQTISNEDMETLNNLTTPEMMIAWKEHYESRRGGDPPPPVIDEGKKE